ncbi:MAX gene-associated protein [Hyperolius riggenbachi]|uniref:MAX gene-associated protein n=1 Tax=Hyperolius riggenbachi TaxID=752182 RepID=UPI0035A2CD9B
MEENTVLNGPPDGGSKPPSTTPAYFYILHQPQGENQKEETILVANRDVSAVAPVVQSGNSDSKSNTFLSAECTSGKITVTLDNNNMWNEFYRCSTEMVLTKQGRRMFPYCRYWISGLEPCQKYILGMDITPLAPYKYKWNGKWWEPGGNAEPHVLGRVFLHPESPSTGQYWMHQPISFYKLKLTNNTLDQEGHIILHSMHRYLPRLHVIPADKATEVIQLNGPGVHTFSFPQTEFFAVTAYQNLQITQLKIDCNPFAKGFRDGTVMGKPFKEGKPKDSGNEKDSSDGKTGESDDPESVGKLKEPFAAFEQSDGDTENESFNVERELISALNPESIAPEELSPKPDHHEPEELHPKPDHHDPEELHPKPDHHEPEELHPKLDHAPEELSPKRDHHAPEESSPKPAPHAPEALSPKPDHHAPEELSPKPAQRVPEELDPKPDHHVSSADTSVVASQPVPTFLPVRIKEEPEDDYDYGRMHFSVNVKQEDCDGVPDEYSNSDNDYPILERVFAQFNTDYSDGKCSVNSPSGVAKAKLKLDDGKMPRLYLESCFAGKSAEKRPDRQASKTLNNLKLRSASGSGESGKVNPRLNIRIKEEPITREDKRRPIKSRFFDDDYSVPEMVKTRTRRRRTRSRASTNSANVVSVFPSGKRRGRPPKNKGAKVGRPAKPVEAPPSSFPDFNPDLEDVDGVLFVAFSSKEALDVHTGGKPKTPTPPDIPAEPVYAEMTEEQRKIVDLERHLLAQLRTMRHRQVIHPALQQVGLKLNIVDHAMSIDLRYLGVELPLPYIASDSRWDDNGLSSEGFPFVSRTGKTTDYKKIKGWRDKFSTNPIVKIEGGSSETSLKNRSAFCSDELDEYLENEAKLIEDLSGPFHNEPVFSTVNCQFPTKSSSYVRTLDSVLKKQAAQVSSSNSLSISKPAPSPVKKRKYTRRNSAAKANPKAKTSLSSPETRAKPGKASQSQKQQSPKQVSSAPVESPVTLQTVVSPPVSEPSVTIQSGTVSPRPENLLPKLCHTVLQSPPSTQRPIGISKAQMKLLEFEEVAVWEGKPRTYITEERADIALSALLTAQASLKNRPVYKMIRKLSPECKNEFCRLGCICSSLNHAKRKPAHCQQEACMFGCNCVKRTLCLEKAKLPVTSSEAPSLNGEDKDPSISTPEEHFDATMHVDEPQAADRTYEPGEAIELHQAKPRGDSFSPLRRPKVFPIWNRSDVDNDPEPICIPEQGEVGAKALHYKGCLEKGKTCSCHRHLASKSAVCPEDGDPEHGPHCLATSCARVRVYKRKASSKGKKDQAPCSDSETAGKEHSSKLGKHREREKENVGDNEIPEKKLKKSDHSSSPKLLNIISDCSWEKDRRKILNIVSQHMDNKEPQSFRVGRFNIELTSENKDGGDSKSSTSRVKISLAPGESKVQAPVKPPLPKPKPESVKVPDQAPSETSNEKEPKSHGAKGLPFYTRVLPAGKMVAQLKTSTANESELIQVNGKNYPQAKLLLGQMGALHPANRLAAYITHRLRPSLLSLSKSKEATAKAKAKDALPESSAAAGNLKDIIEIADASPQMKTSVQSTPSAACNQVVKGDAGNQRQKSARVKSSEPPRLLLPKLHTQLPPLVLTSTPISSNSQVSTPVSSNSQVSVQVSSVNVVPSTPPLSAAAVSPPKKQVPLSPTPMLGVPKLIARDCSPTVSSAVVPTSPSSNNTNTLSSGSPVQEPVAIPPPALIRAPCPPATSSNNPGTNKSLAASVATSLVASASLPTIGMVGSPGRTPTVTLRGVTPSVSVPRATLVSDKRLGPRLLLIPVGTGSSPVRPVQCVQTTSPGQKMVLQPIKNSNGVNLFRHPNGQIIQLVPLQQVPTGNAQSSPQVVLRSSGSAVSIKLPLQTKTDATSTSAATASSSVPPIPITQIHSIPKISPVKSGVTVVPTVVGQANTIRVGSTLLKTSNELSPSKFIAYTTGGHTILTSSGIPLQSGGLQVLKVAQANTLSPGSQTAPTKTRIILMTKKPTVLIDPNKLPEIPLLKSAAIVTASEKNTEENNKTSEDLRSLDNTRNSNGTEGQRESKQSVSSSEQDSVTQSADTRDGEQKSAENEPKRSNTSAEKSTSDTSYKDTLGSPQGGTQSSQSKVIGSPSPTETENLGAKRDKNARKSVVESDDDSSEKDDVILVETLPACTNLVQSAADSQGNNQSTSRSEDKVMEQDNAEALATESKNKEQDGSLITGQGSSPKGREAELSSSEGESEADGSVDIETVEELSEKRNLSRLKASISPLSSDVDVNSTSSDQARRSRKHRKGLKANKDDLYSTVDVESVSYRQNHTANERKRRSEMRDHFDKLKDALGLHNLPKVSKSYILKKAIEEIEGLTDTADSLIKQKTLFSQKQSQLIKKAANLSGKPKEVIVKKLEYMYAKQNALQAGKNKKDWETDTAPKSSVDKPPPPKPAVKQEDKANESSSNKSKPFILSKKPMLPAAGGKAAQPTVITGTSTQRASAEQAVTLKEAGLGGQVSGTTCALLQTDLSSAQMQSGMASVVIRLPNAIQLKGIIGNASVPITVTPVPSTTPADISTDSETDDLAMMPKIVNVTSLANEASLDLCQDVGLHAPIPLKDSGIFAPSRKDATATHPVSQEAEDALASTSSFASTSQLINVAESTLSGITNEGQSSRSRPMDSIPTAGFSIEETSLKSDQGSRNSPSLRKMSAEVRDSGLEQELKKLTAAIEEAELEGSDLQGVVGDRDEDETLTSLLNEIAMLNQQLNNDSSDLGSDFPAADILSQGTAGKSTEGDFLGRLKELSEARERNVSLSPLFLQFDEGDLQESGKPNEDPEIVVFEDGDGREQMSGVMGKPCNLQTSPANVSAFQTLEKPLLAPSTDAFWRPMPKLAPLGLKSPPQKVDARVIGNKSMPSLASAAIRLSSPKPME